jgi:hypothetical protein
MSNARVQFKMATERRATPTKRRRGEVPSAQFNGEERSSHRVLDPDWTLCTLVLVIHEEAVNQDLDTAYFGRIFSDREVSIRALDYIPKYPYPMRAILDFVGFWRLKGFFPFSEVHLVMSYIS